MNLTTEKDAKGSIFFVQKIKFSERLEGHSEATKAFRRMKQQVFTGMLHKLGFDITETNDLFLGVYDTKTETFLNLKLYLLNTKMIYNGLKRKGLLKKIE